MILYFRAYPSLKLRINVNAARNEVDVVMPGLRYDDIDFTGMLVVAQKITHTINKFALFNDLKIDNQ